MAGGGEPKETAVPDAVAVHPAWQRLEDLLNWYDQKSTSKNAVMTQIWIAVCVYLLLAYLKFISRIGNSLQQMIRLLQLNLFERRDLQALLRGDPVEPKISMLQTTLRFS